MTEDLILSEESVASEEQAISETTKPTKKAYLTPQMEIEYFDVEDIITVSTPEDPTGYVGNDPNQPSTGIDG